MARDAVQTMRDNTNYLKEFHEDRRCRIEVFRYPDTPDALYVRDYDAPDDDKSFRWRRFHLKDGVLWPDLTERERQITQYSGPLTLVGTSEYQWNTDVKAAVYAAFPGKEEYTDRIWAEARPLLEGANDAWLCDFNSFDERMLYIKRPSASEEFPDSWYLYGYHYTDGRGWEEAARYWSADEVQTELTWAMRRISFAIRQMN